MKSEWAHDKRAFLFPALDLPNGVPREDVFRCVLSLIHPAAFQGLLRHRAAAATGIDQPVFVVDGKSVRLSPNRWKGLGALHSVRV